MIKGIIFDMDGVISDTQKLHSQVESELLASYGIKLSPAEITAKYSGVRTRDFFADLLARQEQKYDLDKLMLEKWKRMASLANENITAVAGSVDLIKRLFEEGFYLAVASASDLDYINKVLQRLFIASYFTSVVSSEMVKKGKPAPDIFLLAAEQIKIPPAQCLVIEDGFSGMRAAVAAGMKCIGLVMDKNKDYPTKNLVTSLNDITLTYIRNL